MPLDRTWYNTLVDDDGSNTVGSVWNKASVDHIYDDVDAALVTTAHYCELARVSLHDINPNGWFGIYWDYEVSDPFGFITTPTTGITPPIDGWYWVSALVQWAPGTGGRGISVYVAGALDGGEIWTPAINLTVGGVARGLTQSITRLVHAGPTRAIEIRVYHDIGAVLQLQPSGTRVAVSKAS